MACRHLLYIPRMNEGDILPEYYVGKRWMFEIAKEIILDSNGVEIHGDCNKFLIYLGGSCGLYFINSQQKHI